MNQILKIKNFNIGFFTKIINFINVKRKFTPKGGYPYPIRVRYTYIYKYMYLLDFQVVIHFLTFSSVLVAILLTLFANILYFS